MAFKRRAGSQTAQFRRRKTLISPSFEVGVTAEVTELVVRRAMRRGIVCCEVCGDPVWADRGLWWSLHHRRYRDGQPDSHQPQNLILVHGASNVDLCHGVVHDSKAEAITEGWSITRHPVGGRYVDPLTVPVTIDRGSRVVYFTADGTYADSPPATDRSA